MQRELPVWEFIMENLRKKAGVVLLYVTESSGSSPGRQGFIMAANASGEIIGSLGGGVMEYKFAELAKAKLSKNDQTPSLHHQVHNKTAQKNQSGMICSGKQTILMYPVKYEDAGTIQMLLKSLKQFKNGTLQLSLDGISFSENVPIENFVLTGLGKDFLLTVKTGFHNELFIIGAGHCSLAFSKLMSSLGFYIRLYDIRPVLNTLDQNNFVHEKIKLADYAQVSDFIPEGAGKYVVIMTNGYRDDGIALRALIHKTFNYIGVLGSRNKIEQLFANCVSDGILPEVLSRVHAPAGIPIMSQTPDEIAVSIAAQIISVKNTLLK